MQSVSPPTDIRTRVAARGLSSAEAETRLRLHGPNSLPETPRETRWHQLTRQFKSPLIYILLIALLLDTGIWIVEGGRGIPFEGVAIAVILILNAALGVWQERRAEDALARLQELSTPHVRVFRDGILQYVSTTAIVPGDALRLEAGDRMPADAVAFECVNLAMDESVLTGESLPVDKTEQSELFAGTVIVRGTTYATVTQTGAGSTIGRLATMLGAMQSEKTPLERRLVEFGNRVARWILGLVVVIAIGGIAVEGLGHFGHVLLFAVALAVAAVPEGLPAVLTLTLALGVERMARRKAVVRRLAAVEALGSVTVIASDKTGTLTENRMEVRSVESPDTLRAVRAMVLASDAEPGAAVGDPLEIALLHHAERSGRDPLTMRIESPRLSTLPFDSATKFMRVTVIEEGQRISYVKGAPEVILDRCKLDEAERDLWRASVERNASDGNRVLALACGDGATEHDLTWLGLVSLLDPPRPEVPGAIRQAQAAGIRIMMVTGDHPATAATVAKMAGMNTDRVMSGDTFAGLDEPARRRAVQDVDIFARVSPTDKLEIVSLLKEAGEIVAVTGDGVNDAPALKRSDVGVAMGQRGSDVTREVADLVLLDDNFATIVAAIEEGRSIYENIQKFLRFLFSTNLSEILVVAIGAFAAFLLGLRDTTGALLLPLTASQLLWINLVTDGAPALALGMDRNPDVMSQGPRNPREPLLHGPSLRFVLVTGSLKAAVAFAILGLVPLLFGAAPELTRTATFTFMAAGQLLFAYPARHTDLQPRPNRSLHVAVVAGFAAQILTVTVAPLREAFDTVPFTPPVGVWVGASVLIAWAIAEVVGRAIWQSRAIWRWRRTPQSLT